MLSKMNNILENLKRSSKRSLLSLNHTHTKKSKWFCLSPQSHCHSRYSMANPKEEQDQKQPKDQIKGCDQPENSLRYELFANPEG